MRKLLYTLLVLSLGCLTGGSGAMAQNGWEAIYNQKLTPSDTWTELSTDQEGGYTLGADRTEKYYYITKSLNFTNTNAGGSGLTIKGTVYLYIPAGLKITCVGAHASGATGAGAGIELSEGNTLYIIGGGEGTYVEAKGGNAANGVDGGAGTNADGNSDDLWTGTGGTGGNGGGGAGAGIGTRGGNGGTGGSGGAGYKRDWTEYNGTNGSSGNGGSTAGAMGKLYVANGITVNATGGAAASSCGKAGERGNGFIWDGAGNNYTVAGGGGGGGGGFGGAASNIGTGGPGGGGGGGGAGGAQDKRANSKGGVYDVTAYGGKGGTNANGTSAADGEEANTTRSAYENGKVKSEGSTYQWQWNDWNSPSGDCTFGSGGSGGGCGNAASNGTSNAGKLEYTITYHPVKTKVNGKDFNPVTVKYSPSSKTSVVLPQNKDGYQWVLLVYGKSCHPGDPTRFAQPIKIFYGGSEEEEEARTIILEDVYGNIEFQEVAAVCKLNNMGDNSQNITEFFFDETIESQKYPITVRLKDRTLYKDKRWNTICLPFAMTPAQFAASPLAGATVVKLSSKNTGFYSDGAKIPEANLETKDPILVLWFEQVQTAKEGLERGKPYMVKWSEGKDLVDNTKEKIHQLDFNNVTITEKAPGNWYYNDITFQGTFSQSADLKANDITVLILGPRNKLYYPSKDINVGSCRGYFVLPTEVEDAAMARGVVMGFDDGMKTSIQTIKINSEDLNENDGHIYNLSGQRLSTPQRGINIINGKKYIVK